VAKTPAAPRPAAQIYEGALRGLPIILGGGEALFLNETPTCQDAEIDRHARIAFASWAPAHSAERVAEAFVSTGRVGRLRVHMRRCSRCA
jgi:hypothetical protein